MYVNIRVMEKEWYGGVGGGEFYDGGESYRHPQLEGSADDDDEREQDEEGVLRGMVVVVVVARVMDINSVW